MTPSPREDLAAVISAGITGMVTPPGPLRPSSSARHGQRRRTWPRTDGRKPCRDPPMSRL